MGFLLGAFGKQMAGKRLRALQARMMNVQSRLRRATRDIEQMEKFWSRVEKDNKNMMTMAMQAANIGIQQNLQSSVFNDIANRIGQETATAKGIDLAAIRDGNLQEISKLGSTEAQQFTEILANNRTQSTYVQQALQAAMQQQMAMQENMIEAQKEAQLMPLKDLEDDLQTEKDSLESQIQLAQADYDGCKEMEKAGAKNMVPQYTGQG